MESALRVIGVVPEASAANGAGRFLQRQAILHPRGPAGAAWLDRLGEEGQRTGRLRAAAMPDNRLNLD